MGHFLVSAVSSRMGTLLSAYLLPVLPPQVVYKRPTDLHLKTDVPLCCNLLVCDMMDDALLSSGMVPSIQHALQHLMVPDAAVIPAAATVYAQPAACSVKSIDAIAVDLSALDRYR